MSRLTANSYEAIILNAIREPLLDLVNEHNFAGIDFRTDGVTLKTANRDYVLELTVHDTLPTE